MRCSIWNVFTLPTHPHAHTAGTAVGFQACSAEARTAASLHQQERTLKLVNEQIPRCAHLTSRAISRCLIPRPIQYSFRMHHCMHSSYIMKVGEQQNISNSTTLHSSTQDNWKQARVQRASVALQGSHLPGKLLVFITSNNPRSFPG